MQAADAIGDQVLDIWPENAAAVGLFEDLLTSWNVGPGGVVGLRYEVLPLFLDINGIAAADRRGVVSAVQVMEQAALKSLNRST